MLVRPDSIPEILPRGLLSALVAHWSMLLLLDFDGTLSNIASHPDHAVPLRGAREVLARLVRHQARVKIAIISGRPVASLRRLLGVAGVTLVGCHGVEALQAGRRSFLLDTIPSARSIARVRRWLRSNIPASAGFVVEDKHVAIALHYRMAYPASALVLRGKFRKFVTEHAPLLRVAEGKKVIEALPRGASKALAARLLARRAGSSLVVCVGDDVTDEDTFYQLRREGLGILVGRRTSWAHWRAATPARVVRELQDLADALEHRTNASRRAAS